MELAAFSDLVGPNGSPLPAAPETGTSFPQASGLVEIKAVKVPPVAMNPLLPPVILVRPNTEITPGVKVLASAVGFPAFAKLDPIFCNNGRDPSNPRNNICRDQTNNLIPDQSRWINADGTAWTVSITSSLHPPLIDLNGDRVPDNFSMRGGAYLASLSTNVAMAGDGAPSRDMTATGVLDMDLNDDAVADLVAFSSGNFRILLGNDLTDQGNPNRTLPAPERGFVPSAWTGKSGQLAALLPLISTAPGNYYEVAVARYYDDAIPAYSGAWSSVTMPATTNLSDDAFEAMAAGAPITAARISGLDLPVPNYTRLAQALTPDTTAFLVVDGSSLRLPGLVYVGSEIMRVARGTGNQLLVIPQSGDPSPGNGRGLQGSAPIAHLPSEPVSDAAAIFLARFVSPAGTSAPRPMFVYRVRPDAASILVTAVGANIAPTGAVVDELNVPLYRLEVKTNTGMVELGQLRLFQTGTVVTSSNTGGGEGDFKRLMVWADGTDGTNGDRVFTPRTDRLVGVIGQTLSTGTWAQWSSTNAMTALGLSTTSFYDSWKNLSGRYGTQCAFTGTFSAGSFTCSVPGVWTVTCSMSSGGSVSCVSGVDQVAALQELMVSTEPFFGKTPILTLNDGNGLPLVVTKKPLVLFVAADIGKTDKFGSSTLGHQAGVSLGAVLGPNGAPLAAPIEFAVPSTPDSGLVVIKGFAVPMVSVSVSSSLPPIVMVKASTNTPATAVGYPAFALTDPVRCNNGRNPSNPRNNMCKDSKGNWAPDPGYWLCVNGSSWATRGGNPPSATVKISSWTGVDGSTWTLNCPSDPPLLDVNGDRVPDNFSMGSGVNMTLISIVGDGAPARDLTGTGILDMDVNQDGIADIVTKDGSGKIKILLGNDPADQGNPDKAVAVPETAFVPSAWVGKLDELGARMPFISTNGYYEFSAGASYDTEGRKSYSGSWGSVTVKSTRGLNLQGFRALVDSTSAAVTTAKIKGLSLPIPNVTKLIDNLAADTTSFQVKDASALDVRKLVFVGNEIMRVKRGSGNTLIVVGQEGDPAPGNGRGLGGSMPMIHLGGEKGGEPVSDGAAIIFARWVSSDGAKTDEQPMFLFRPDTKAPTAPGAIQINAGGAGAKTSVFSGQSLRDLGASFAIQWKKSSQDISGVTMYEIQARGGPALSLQQRVVWRKLKDVTATEAETQQTTVGEEEEFDGNLFYEFRVRAMSGALIASAWSVQATESVSAGLTKKVIDGVSNYPNPFDTRTGGAGGKTTITYILGQNSDVTITIYDMLGYIVTTQNYTAGSEGGRVGPNYVTWDGRNAAGRLVGKGGYVARIKVKAPGGSANELRKIGVIH